jgi:phenylalanyl-tRNA synthetase beta chain
MNFFSTRKGLSIMLASSRWLKDYVTLPDPFVNALARLTAAGIEVASIRALGEDISGVVVAQILEVAKHPQADRLSLTKVTDGRETYQVVCGAKNIAPGQKVPLALVGATLPGGFKLEKAKIRGIESFGMMCSSKELGLAEEAAGIFILPDDAPLGMDLMEYLGLPETLFEVEITPNRADLLSHYGIARELGAQFNLKTQFPEQPALKETNAPASEKISVSVEDPLGCPLYSCRVIENVKVGESPRWLKEKLERIGQRSINNVVDITNFVLMELGQPLHAFDYDLLAGNRVIVRRARSGERISLLDGTERTLTPDALVIADAEKPSALAGIMGGGQSMVTNQTHCILLEAALFNGGLIRKTARRLGLSTDSSYRFERGVDPVMVRKALDRAAALIHEVAGGEIRQGVVETVSQPYEKRVILFRPERCNQLLGLQLKGEEQLSLLSRLGCHISPTGLNANVDVPSWRVDIHQEIDLIEEVARMNGYDLLPLDHPAVRISKLPLPEVQRPTREARHAFLRRGLSEAVNTSFLPPDFAEKLRLSPEHPYRNAPKLANPIADDQTVLRPTLVPSLLVNVQFNLAHQQDSVWLFEINKVFAEAAKGPVEKNRATAVLAGLAPGSGWYNPARETDFFDLKGLAQDLASELIPGVDLTWDFSHEESPYQKGFSFHVTGPQGQIFFWGGAIDPKVKKAYDVNGSCWALEVELDACWEAARKSIQTTSLPKFPSARRDLALVVPDEHQAAEIEASVRENGGNTLIGVECFDLYRGKNLPAGRRSLAYRLVFQAPDRTLTDAEVNDRVAKIVETLQSRYGVALR